VYLPSVPTYADDLRARIRGAVSDGAPDMMQCGGRLVRSDCRWGRSVGRGRRHIHRRNWLQEISCVQPESAISSTSLLVFGFTKGGNISTLSFKQWNNWWCRTVTYVTKAYVFGHISLVTSY